MHERFPSSQGSEGTYFVAKRSFDLPPLFGALTHNQDKHPALARWAIFSHRFAALDSQDSREAA